MVTDYTRKIIISAQHLEAWIKSFLNFKSGNLFRKLFMKTKGGLFQDFTQVRFTLYMAKRS